MDSLETGPQSPKEPDILQLLRKRELDEQKSPVGTVTDGRPCAVESEERVLTARRTLLLGPEPYRAQHLCTLGSPAGKEGKLRAADPAPNPSSGALLIQCARQPFQVSVFQSGKWK